MHDCPMCGKRTRGTIMAGGAMWDACSDCVEQDVGMHIIEGLNFRNEVPDDQYEEDPEELGTEYEQWLDTNGL